MQLNTSLEKMLLHDARLEALAAELLDKRQVSLDALVVRPKSTFRRAYSRDVTGFELSAAGKKKSETVVTLDVSREGLYDALPEFFFHQPDAASAHKTLEQRVKSSERVREQEAESRKFLLPFEQEFFRKKIQVEQEERRLLPGADSPMQQMLFEKFWTDLSGSGEQSKAILFYLLPLTHQIAGDLPLMEQCFSAVLAEPVRMRKRWRRQAAFSEDDAPTLGAAGLGHSFILGDSVTEELPELEITVGPVELTSVPHYVEGGTKQRLLQILNDYFVPVEFDTRTQLLVKQENCFLLDEEASTGRLGLSTVI